MRRRTALTAAVTLLVAACGQAVDTPGQAPDTTDTTTTTAPVTTQGTRPPIPSGPQSVANLPNDDRARANPTSDPPEVLAGPTETGDELARVIAQRLYDRSSGDEGFRGVFYTTREIVKGRTARIDLRVDGRADDSVGGFHYTVQVALTGDGWRSVSATREAICHRGTSGGLCA